jgi:hypothetical protein
VTNEGAASEDAGDNVTGRGRTGRDTTKRPLPPTACSVLSAALEEPMAGTAANATTWLCIEQSGPYGADALTESHFDPVLGAELAARVKGTGVRIQLIRRPGRHADRHLDAGAPPTHDRRAVYVAHTRPGRTWIHTGAFDDLTKMLSFDFEALAAGVEPQTWGMRDDTPLLLVCSNGRRDVCCAVLGRPIAAELARRHPDGTVWETTHTGGHRLAPTAVVLPTGYLYGRLDIEHADRVMSQARRGLMVVDRCRGRSTWSAPGQVADLAVRELIDEPLPDVVRVEPEEPGELAVDDDPAMPYAAQSDRRGWRVRASAAGREFVVWGREEVLRPERRTSCAKAPVTPTAHQVTRVEETTPAD